MGSVRSSSKKKKKTLARVDKNLFASSAETVQRKSTNELLVSHVLRIQRVLVLYRHHAEHCSNIRDQKDFAFVEKLKKKTLLLSQAVSGLGVGLLLQPVVKFLQKL